MKKLPLHKFHEKLGAQFVDVRGWTIPSSYSAVDKELDAIINHVGLLDRSYLGKIFAKGTDATDLINRISTNDMNQLIMGAMCDTVFCSPNGRIIDYAKVLQYDESLLLISSYIDNDHLMEWINRFIILENVELEDCSDKFLWLTLLGPEAGAFIHELSGTKTIDQPETIWLERDGIKFPALINTNLKVPAYNFCLPINSGESIFKWIADSLEKFNGTLIGDHAFQIIRVESGMPDWGSELTEEYNPHEARLIEAVSFTKGCYTGQEVIARLDTYDKVQKYLMIIELQEQIFAEPTFDIFYDNNKIGVLTSHVYNPENKRSIGLGYIKKNLTVADFDLTVEVLVSGKMIPAKLRIPVSNI
ncbi:MAG: aminomethyl transferase family protein [Calditrichaeota bacterium]|nr:MAG: aminomethyl transferase family protein [Calditrichota bacterium]MBL1206133.1 aminomethyl transferase family protein [Calditrichota bacterium]NOG45958.1 aminomethyl transferase family protein [Calditrichota bacterium]